MKQSKRLLALMLTLVLAFSLALPALAEDADPPEEPNPAMPVITVQPVGGRARQYGITTLSVQAYIPNGDEIGYQWYRDNSDEFYIWEEDGKSATLSDWSDSAADYYVVVYNLNHPECSVTSETVHIDVYRTFSDRFSDFLTRTAIMEKIFAPVEWLVQGIGLLLFLPLAPFIVPPFPGLIIFLPFIYLFNWIRGLFQ